jgi:hypothetical protein
MREGAVKPKTNFRRDAGAVHSIAWLYRLWVSQSVW